MPHQAKSICRKAGCNHLLDKPGYCQIHGTLASGWYVTSRATSTQRGYGAHWRKLREQTLERDRGLCQPCEAEGRARLATEVDHRVAKSNGGNDELANLQAICRECHRRKTAADRRQRRSTKTGGGSKSFPPNLKNRRRGQIFVGA